MHTFITIRSLSTITNAPTQKIHTNLLLNQQELRQRGGDHLPGYTHWPVKDQSVHSR